MKGVVFLGDRKAEVHEYPNPEPGPGEVVVKLMAGGLCGSDLHLYRQTAAEREGNTMIPGHEPSGIVHAIGSCVDTVEIGDRVSVYHYRGCGYCEECLSGHIMWCDERRGYGGPIHGSDADYILTDARNCLPLPDNFTFAAGAMMACNAGTAFSAMSKLRASGKDTVVVMGLGPVGLAGVMFGNAMGARVIGVEPIPARRELARDLGAVETIDPTASDVVEAIRSLTRGRGADGGFETSGSAAGQSSIVESLRNGGSGVFVGIGSQGKTINPAQFIGQQLTLMGSFVFPINMYFEMVRFIQDNGLALDDLVSHRFSIDQAPEAFKLFDSGQTGKVIFEWQ